MPRGKGYASRRPDQARGMAGSTDQGMRNTAPGAQVPRPANKPVNNMEAAPVRYVRPMPSAGGGRATPQPTKSPRLSGGMTTTPAVPGAKAKGR